ncbi:MAG: SDR family oxidoreductase [Elusimicrobia bacterium]|nr:SDR family oxidoreductase [Elusimicrobiota bacterium]
MNSKEHSNKRILILGGAGTLGHKLWQIIPQKFPDTYVTVRKSKDFYAKTGLFSSEKVIELLDLRDFSQLEKVLNELKPDIILNCAGVTLRSKEAKDEVSNIAVNALLPNKLAEWCSNNNSRLIHFSTVCVFTGKDGNYNDESIPDAQDLYGRTKTLGEVNKPCALVLRSSFIGIELFGGMELLEWFLAQEGKTIKGFRKAIFTGLTTNYLAKVVCYLIENHPNLSGIYNVSSEIISKYDLLNLAKEAYKLDIKIEPEDKFECQRDLNGERFNKAIDFKCPSWKELMTEMAADTTPYKDWRK